MTVNAAESIRIAIRESSFLKGLAAARIAHADSASYRDLTSEEIEALKSQGNGAADWTLVRVARDFRPSKVVGCWFSGPVKLGSFSRKVTVEEGVQLGSGVYRSDLQNVTVGDNALIHDVGLLAHTVVGEGAVVMKCGMVACTGETRFGNGTVIPIAIESGGRETTVYSEITVEVAAQIAGHRQDRDGIEAARKATEEYLALASSDLMVIEAGARVSYTPKVVNTYVGPGAVIDAAQWVENTTLLSLPDEPAKIRAGSYVRNAILQWGSDVDSMGLVVNSVLCEHSHVERHGKLTNSILGPNSTVAGGECSASLCGPFVGFHHQALLIAAFWPEGKGNIGYGANVGSNHTSKSPDQEIWPGEGTNFGLGVNIKFPSDFTRAPYSIIASGVTSLPQRIEMPFALINTPGDRIDGISPACNEIMPGWVLSDNIFSVFRNENKYTQRNKAKRAVFTFEIFRPEIVERMREARKALIQAEGRGAHKDGQGRPVFTDDEIRGLGKNYLKEDARINGIAAYTFYIRYYALRGLKRVVAAGGIQANLLIVQTHDTRWEHERGILNAEFQGKGVADLLKELIKAQEKIARDTQGSKEKDDRRGARVIETYPHAHAPASEDDFVQEMHRRTAQLTAEVLELLDSDG